MRDVPHIGHLGAHIERPSNALAPGRRASAIGRRSSARWLSLGKRWPSDYYLATCAQNLVSDSPRGIYLPPFQTARTKLAVPVAWITRSWLPMERSQLD